MENQQVVNYVQPKISEDLLETAQWQWQSDQDPWKEKDQTKWTWQNYSTNESLTIEEAFSLGKEIAELNGYEIDLKKMLQVNKNFKHLIRRIRRHERSRFMIEISEPVAVVKDQKTVNQAFGTIQHFLDFMMKRTPEAYGLYKRLKRLPLDWNKFQDIIEEVVECVEKSADVREKIVKTRSCSQTTTFASEAKRIVDLINGNSSTLGDFLKTILKVYTMETFVCYWLNELLRSEDWEEINVLTPYLVCLVYTFKCSEYIIRYQEPHGVLGHLLGFVKKPKLYLYRGAALTLEQVNHYLSQKLKYFSWNGVTSTSRNKAVALKFIQASLQKAKMLNQPKVGVIFSIEKDFASPRDCEGMIDTLQNSCTQYPDEQEVILAPGTVFKMRKARLVENHIYEVTLKIQRKFNETKEDIALLGNLQSKGIFREKVIIQGLPSEESFRLLELLRGNQLIQWLEIRNSGIGEHLMEEIESFRVTTNVKKQNIKFVQNTIAASSFSQLAHYFSSESLSDICMLNNIRFNDKIVKNDQKDNDWKIKSLILKEGALQTFSRNGQVRELWGKIKNDDQITKLDISMKTIAISDHEFQIFLECLKEMKVLEDLSLCLNPNHLGSKGNFKHLCQAIGSSSTITQLSLILSTFTEELSSVKIPLQSLALNFSESCEIADEGLFQLKNTITPLASLQHLFLDFAGCHKILDQGLNYLKDGLISLTSLHHLSLNFEKCSKISDQGLNHLRAGLKSLESLQNLSLNFDNCVQISDLGVNHLSRALISLKSLQSLSLNFDKCLEISDLGLNPLKQALTPLISLKNLSLKFYGCNRISDQGLNHLKQALTPLTSLQNLSLDFHGCNRISDKGLKHLKSALALLTSLQSLCLNFHACDGISDNGLDHLSDALWSLENLKNLSLDFGWCNVSDEGLEHLIRRISPMGFSHQLCKVTNLVGEKKLDEFKETVVRLLSLQHLSLSFRGCKTISNTGLSCITSALSPFTSLLHLSLDFAYSNISDKGLDYFFGSTLTTFESLQDLSLKFDNCHSISDQGLNHLKNSLAPLTGIQSFSLSLCDCPKISDQGINYLKSTLTLLASLQHLSLNLGNLDSLSDRGLSYLKDALSSLTSLQSLSIDLRCSDEISNEGLYHLASALMSLKSLKHLSLDFHLCLYISSEGVYHFMNAIRSLASLQSVCLNFKMCTRVSAEVSKHFCNEFKRIQNFKFLK